MTNWIRVGLGEEEERKGVRSEERGETREKDAHFDELFGNVGRFVHFLEACGLLVELGFILGNFLFSFENRFR